MVGRHRDLAGADEVEVLALDPVDVVGGLAEEAGALHRARLDQRRRDHLGEAGLAGLVHRQVDQRELELGADAGQEVEPRAADLGAALEVDGAEHPAELDVVARLEVELARRPDVLEDDEVVLAAGGRLVGGEVGDRLDRLVPRRPRPRCGRPRPPSPRPPAPCRASRACFSSPWACATSSPSWPSARPAWPRSRRSPAPRGVGRQRPVHDVGGQARLAWAARTRSGSSRRRRGSITRQGYRRRAIRDCRTGSGIFAGASPPPATAAWSGPPPRCPLRRPAPSW